MIRCALISVVLLAPFESAQAQIPIPFGGETTNSAAILAQSANISCLAWQPWARVCGSAAHPSVVVWMSVSKSGITHRTPWSPPTT